MLQCVEVGIGDWALILAVGFDNGTLILAVGCQVSAIHKLMFESWFDI
jgi:hypothetical protein